jgi:SAM-dependent methyltransferase
VPDREEWADGSKKRMIVEQRRFLWSEGQVQRLASAMGLCQGMTVADIGCGQGYLGWTYWRFYGKDGTYFGADCSAKLLDEAAELAGDWAKGGSAVFTCGDCYGLPLPDGCADVSMCQTLLMHLEFPERALGEMIRITRPGGTVMCKEPDNVSSFLKKGYSSVFDLSVDDMLFHRKMMLIWAEGTRRLGMGDWGIGSKLPGMMYEAGLAGIEGFCNERLDFLQPPYDTPLQQSRLETLRKNHERRDEETPERKREFRERYLAGGGSMSSFYRNYGRLLKLFGEDPCGEMLDRFEKGDLVTASGGSTFFCVMGRKPG